MKARESLDVQLLGHASYVLHDDAPRNFMILHGVDSKDIQCLGKRCVLGPSKALYFLP